MAKAIVSAKAYREFFHELKSRIEQARGDVARSVNTELIGLYRDIGTRILDKQEAMGWGRNVIERLSQDLVNAFPGARGFSPQNLWLMRQFVLEYRALPKLQQLVGELPWGHNVLLMQKIKHPEARTFYLRSAAQFGWSRSILLNQIKAKAYQRSLKEGKSHNFRRALSRTVARRAEDVLKSAYDLGFLGITAAHSERALEDKLIDRVQQFILELGYGFCFVGRQHRLTLGRKEYFIDLLFYHRFLRSLVAIELKVGSFEPEYAGKMDFYLNLLNDKERAPGDNPSIGIILCAEKDGLEVEYSLRSKSNPIGVADYAFTRKLPKNLSGKLPTAQELEAAVRLVIPERTHKKSTRKK
ncbi:MAG: DUF1016 family protein [Flavobacteriales bacterium]|nr:DUF1016 family protein [Flavobacteriales bacterium]